MGLSRTGPPLVAALILTTLAPSLDASGVSWGAMTPLPVGPATQRRTNRHFLVLEKVRDCIDQQVRAILYDSRGLEEPRDVSPGGAPSTMSDAAVWEGGDGSLRLLIACDAPLPSEDQGTRLFRGLYSGDGGRTWSAPDLDHGPQDWSLPLARDVGGPVARDRNSAFRIGTAAMPFLVLCGGRDFTTSLRGVRADGSAVTLAVASYGSQIVGMDSEGAHVLLVSDSLIPASGSVDPRLGTPGVSIVDQSGQATKCLDVSRFAVEQGFISAEGGVYLEGQSFGADPSGEPPNPFTAPRAIGLVWNGAFTELATSSNDPDSDLFVAPTADFSGAWICQRDAEATTLSSHSRGSGLVQAWSDPTRPLVDAVYAGASGTRLLLQAHRTRPLTNPTTGQPLIADPLLATWNVGDVRPMRYDELFLDAPYDTGFVHVDVDAFASGAGYVLSLGAENFNFCTDFGIDGLLVRRVEQVGIVRGSDHRRLVIAAAARIAGSFGAAWRTDLVLRNPDVAPVRVSVTLLENPDLAPAGLNTEVLVPASSVIRVRDVLSSLFGLSAGAGALLLEPEGSRAIEATSHTYTSSAAGSYGMSVPAVDAAAAVGSRYPVSFSAGLLGGGFRTNLVATDVSGRSATAAFGLAGPASPVAAFTAPASGQNQISDLGARLGVAASQSGSVLFAPSSGESVVGLIVIDDATNDPTWFGPDVPTSVMRTIPAIVHADGLNGARFRTDVFLFNPASIPQTVTLAAKLWALDTPDVVSTLILGPAESRTIPDVLGSLGLSGVARLRVSSVRGQPALEGGVRVTSRTYTVAPSGATYGLPFPPLEDFQSAGAGESLELLLPAGGPSFRTNLALVDLGDAPKAEEHTSVGVEIYADAGALLDRFEADVPIAGGIQMTDLFRSRGLGDGHAAAWIRVSPAGGRIAAYATVIDQGTNAPLYAPASLAQR